MPIRTKAVNRSWIRPSHPDLPISGMAKVLRKTSPNASTMVVSRMRKPQKMKACMMPGPNR